MVTQVIFLEISSMLKRVIANGSKVGTPTSEFNPDWTFYFIRRTSSLSEKTEPK
jgi:hypothetical protein